MMRLHLLRLFSFIDVVKVVHSYNEGNSVNDILCIVYLTIFDNLLMRPIVCLILWFLDVIDLYLLLLQLNFRLI